MNRIVVVVVAALAVVALALAGFSYSIALSNAAQAEARNAELEKRLASVSSNVALAEAKNVELEKRIAAAEKQLAYPFLDLQKRIEPGPREKELNLTKLRAAYARQTLLREVLTRSVLSARTFLDLTTAREAAGQVTKMDVFNADVQMRGTEVSLLSIQRWLHEAEMDLKDAIGEDAVKAIPVATIDFGLRTVKDGTMPEIQSDSAAGTVSLVTLEFDPNKMNAGKEVSRKVLFQATRVPKEILAKAVENTPADVRPQYRRKLDTAFNALQQLEREVLARGRSIEQAKRALEAAQLSYDRSTKDSFDVIRTEDSLRTDKLDFVNRKLDYEVQLAELEYLLPNGLK